LWNKQSSLRFVLSNLWNKQTSLHFDLSNLWNKQSSLRFDLSICGINRIRFASIFLRCRISKVCFASIFTILEEAGSFCFDIENDFVAINIQHYVTKLQCFRLVWITNLITELLNQQLFF
jgi:hypothetical protein